MCCQNRINRNFITNLFIPMLSTIGYSGFWDLQTGRWFIRFGTAQTNWHRWCRIKKSTKTNGTLHGQWGVGGIFRLLPNKTIPPPPPPYLVTLKSKSHVAIFKFQPEWCTIAGNSFQRSSKCHLAECQLVLKSSLSPPRDKGLNYFSVPRDLWRNVGRWWIHLPERVHSEIRVGRLSNSRRQ